MRLAITGTPGVGKTTIAKRLGGLLGYKAVNEKEFCILEGIIVGGGGEIDEASMEVEVELKKLERSLNKLLSKQKNIIFEGHLLCEIKGKFDVVVLVKCNPEVLERRLETRGYSDVKVQDNVFCEGIEYCKKHCYRNYPGNRVVEVDNSKDIKETLYYVIVNLQRVLGEKVKVKVKKQGSKKTKGKAT